MKKLVVFAISLFVMMFGATCFASENESVIHEREIKVVSVDTSKSNAITTTTVVEIEGEKLIKISKVYSHDGGNYKDFFVRYVRVDGSIKAAYSWNEKNGKKIYRKGKKHVTIVTEK